MTLAERKFFDIEGGLMRAKCLVRVLLEVCDGGRNYVDPVLSDGVYVLIGEVETAIDEAAQKWTEGSALTR